MKKVLILPALVLAFGAQTLIAQAQGKGPDNDNITKTVASDHSNNARKEQPKEQPKEQAKEPSKPAAAQGTADQPDQKETEKPVAASTASVTKLDDAGDDHAATSDAPVKTTPNVPVSGTTSTPSNLSKAASQPKSATKDVAASKKPDKKSDKKDKSAPAKNASTPSTKNSSTSNTNPVTIVPTSTAPSLTAPASTGHASTEHAPAIPATVVPAPVAPASAANSAPLPTSIYRIGIGDVLDIRLLNAASRESTLYTVMSGGLLEYPLAGSPLQVAGLTTEEISARLVSSVKVYDNPQFVVSVREYASHTVIVTGLVSNPGPRILRREAMPLYVVLAEAQPHAEAARAAIMRPGTPNMNVDLMDSAATSTLVLSGDVIKVMAAPPAPAQFYFIGGQVNSPGQKDFHAGLTLTQAVLASGGISRFANSKVRVSRQGADGRLVMTEYNLKQIEEGKVPDPTLQAGDRVEVGRGHW